MCHRPSDLAVDLKMSDVSTFGGLLPRERERGTSGLASTQTKREEQCGGAIGVLFAAAASIDSKQLLHTILRYSARSMLSV